MRNVIQHKFKRGDMVNVRIPFRKCNRIGLILRPLDQDNPPSTYLNLRYEVFVGRKKKTLSEFWLREWKI